MAAISLNLLDQEEALRIVSRLKMTDTARLLIDAIIKEVWLETGHITVSYFSDWYNEKYLGLTRYKTKKALNQLAALGLLEHPLDYYCDIYYISIRGFYNFRRTLPEVRTREELKSIIKLVVSNQ